MKFSTLLIAFVFFVGWTTKTIGQKTSEPDYRFDLDSDIIETIHTEFGIHIVITKKSLVGIQPRSNDLLFNFTDFRRLKFENLTFVPNTPYLIINQEPTYTKKIKTVINYLSGKIIFNSKENDWYTVDRADVILPQNKLVVNGWHKSPGERAVAIYDLNTGEEESYMKLKNLDIFGAPPLLLSDGLIFARQGKLIKVDLKTASELWSVKTQFLGFFYGFRVDETEKEIYGFDGGGSGNTRIHKIGVDGSLLWEKSVKVNGKVEKLKILPQGLLIVSNFKSGSEMEMTLSKKINSNLKTGSRYKSKIALLSASTGEDLWEKAPKTKGYVQHFFIEEDGILFGTYEGGINKISFDGIPLYKKPLKTGENIITMASTPKGLLYITSEDANIVNMETGVQVWEKPLNYKRADVVSLDFDVKHNRYLINADEELFSVNINTGESKILAITKFKGKEKPTQVEIREGGILLSSSQNITLLDWNGNKLWHEFYRGGGYKISQREVESAFEDARTSKESYDTSVKNYPNRLYYDKSSGKTFGYVSSGMAVSLDYANEYYNNRAKRVASIQRRAIDLEEKKNMRIKATASTKDYHFVFTLLDDVNGIVKLNKDTGENEKEILIENLNPQFIVDQFSGTMFYKAGNRSIYVYDLNK